MVIDLSKLPDWAKLEVTKADLESFAKHLLRQEGANANTKATDEILWMDDAVKLLNLAKPTIYGLINKRKINFYKKGRKVYFLRSELEAWLMSGRQKTHAELAQDAAKHLAEKSRKHTSSTKK